MKTLEFKSVKKTFKGENGETVPYTDYYALFNDCLVIKFKNDDDFKKLKSFINHNPDEVIKLCGELKKMH